MKTKAIIYLLIIFCYTCPGFGQEIEVPVIIQYSLFSKIFTYERNLISDLNKELTIGIIFQSRFRMSLDIKNEFLDIYNQKPDIKFAGRSLRLLEFDLEQDNIESLLSSDDVDILYVSPLRAYDIQEILNISRNNKIITITGIQNYCENGVSICVGQKGGNPQIIINLTSAQLEGADLSSQILKLAKVIY